MPLPVVVKNLSVYQETKTLGLFRINRFARTVMLEGFNKNPFFTARRRKRWNVHISMYSTNTESLDTSPTEAHHHNSHIEMMLGIPSLSLVDSL